MSDHHKRRNLEREMSGFFFKWETGHTLSRSLVSDRRKSDFPFFWLSSTSRDNMSVPRAFEVKWWWSSWSSLPASLSTIRFDTLSPGMTGIGKLVIHGKRLINLGARKPPNVWARRISSCHAEAISLASLLSPPPKSWPKATRPMISRLEKHINYINETLNHKKLLTCRQKLMEPYRL